MNKSMLKAAWVALILPCLLATGNIHAHDLGNEGCKGDDCPHNIQIGSRMLSDEARNELSVLRELKAAEGEDVKEGSEDNTLTPKGSLFKEFYQLHYASFHRPTSIAFDGSTLELEDGSMWTIKYSIDRMLALGWSTRDSLVIEQWDSSGFEYKILNQTKDEYVIASPILGPIYTGIHTHWIKSIDSFGTIKLEDGSEWDTFSRQEIALWLPNDTVIVGAYRTGASYNTIFINVNQLSYARVKLNWKK